MAVSDLFDDERDEVLALLELAQDTDGVPASEHLLDALLAIDDARPPDDLGDAVARRARDARAAGRASGPAPRDVTALEAFRETVDDLDALLMSLSPSDWSRATTGYGDVHGIIAHLVGIERLALGWFGALPMPRDEIAADHLAASRESIAELATAEPSALRSTWRDLADRVADAAAAAPDDLAIMAHDIPVGPDGAMLLRTFELWAHHDDIAVATDRPLLAIDAGRLLTLSTGLVRALPFTFALRGDHTPEAAARIVLTGTGGGTYDLAYGGDDDRPRDVTIVVDTYQACRMAQQRLARDEVRVDFEGDADLGELLVAEFGAFARD
jgi:uncharacterized protein (TIGR03083 family)